MQTGNMPSVSPSHRVVIVRSCCEIAVGALWKPNESDYRVNLTWKTKNSLQTDFTTWGEQSRYSNHARAHTVKLGRMTMQTQPWPPCQTQFYRVYQATQTPLFSNPLKSSFDTQVYHERQICSKFHQIFRVILEMAFSAHCTQIWKLIRISMIIINKVARKCTGVSDAWRCPTGG